MSTETQTRIPAINQPWPEQGGIYIGSRLIEGALHHVIIPGGVEYDHVDIPFARAKTTISESDELNGFSDWRAPDQEDLMLAWINARERFVQKGSDSIYWSRSEHHGWPWAVDFENGDSYRYRRHSEFRVRPVRSFTLSDD